MQNYFKKIVWSSCRYRYYCCQIKNDKKQSHKNTNIKLLGWNDGDNIVKTSQRMSMVVFISVMVPPNSSRLTQDSTQKRNYIYLCLGICGVSLFAGVGTLFERGGGIKF